MNEPAAPAATGREADKAATARSAAALFGLRPPVLWSGARFTPRRVQNLVNVRSEMRRGAVRLSSFPLKITVEPTNVCNLRCPACFTGAERPGRPRRPMPLHLFESLVEELGPYAFEISFHNWGEPLLAKDLPTMIAMARRLGVSTTVSSNLSIPFDAARAEALVASGLDVLGVSLDGATQETYEQYRRRGRLALALENCRMMRDAKRRLGSTTPRLVWEYHLFPHNAHEIEAARVLAAELEMDVAVEKGWVVGDDWEAPGGHRAYEDPKPGRCHFLWYHAVINNDGGVSPCCGTYYPEDDFARISTESLRRTSFHQVWNSRGFQEARRLFRRRVGSPQLARTICYDCPKTVIWERFKRHLAEAPGSPFDVGITANDAFNHAWNRRPETAGALVPLAGLAGGRRRR